MAILGKKKKEAVENTENTLASQIINSLSFFDDDADAEKKPPDSRKISKKLKVKKAKKEEETKMGSKNGSLWNLMAGQENEDAKENSSSKKKKRKSKKTDNEKSSSTRKTKPKNKSPSSKTAAKRSHSPFRRGKSKEENSIIQNNSTWSFFGENDEEPCKSPNDKSVKSSISSRLSRSRSPFHRRQKKQEEPSMLVSDSIFSPNKNSEKTELKAESGKERRGVLRSVTPKSRRNSKKDVSNNLVSKGILHMLKGSLGKKLLLTNGPANNESAGVTKKRTNLGIKTSAVVHSIRSPKSSVRNMMEKRKDNKAAMKDGVSDNSMLFSILNALQGRLNCNSEVCGAVTDGDDDGIPYMKCGAAGNTGTNGIKNKSDSLNEATFSRCPVVVP